MLKEIPQPKEIAAKIKEQFKGTSWEQPLRYFLESKDLEQIIEELIDLKRCSMSFVPVVKNIFGFLQATGYKDIKAVMLIDTKINRVKGNKGIPMSGIRDTYQWSLINKIFWSIDKEYKGSYNLERWCKQGILMIPISPTQTEDGDMHYDLWKGFISNLISVINEQYKEIPWLLVKQKTSIYKPLIKSPNVLDITTYPMISPKDWHVWTNNLIEGKGQKAIVW